MAPISIFSVCFWTHTLFLHLSHFLVPRWTVSVLCRRNLYIWAGVFLAQINHCWHFFQNVLQFFKVKQNTTCPHLFLKIFVDFLTSTLLHDALVKSTTKIFSNFVAISEKSNYNWNICQRVTINCWVDPSSNLSNHSD